MAAQRNRYQTLISPSRRAARIVRTFLPLLLVIALCGGCDDRNEKLEEDMREMVRKQRGSSGAEDPGSVVSIAREEKDRMFRSENSPLPEGEREAFGGLRYYPYDSAFRVIGTFEPLDTLEVVTLGTSTGEPRRTWRVGTIRFTVGDVEETLNAYVDEVDADHLFLPFRDRTSGKETYGAGRYLETERHGREARNVEDVVLDFNQAYNPFCAYNESYSCPLVPAENNLSIEIEAGEMAYTHD